MSVIAVPNSQKHEAIIPAYIPVYNHILVTPNQSRNQTILSTNSNSDSITFEISGDNCVNLSKTYLEFELDYTPGAVRNHNPNPAGGGWAYPWAWNDPNINNLVLRNSMNFGSLKVYNKTGTLLCDLDSSYNEYNNLAYELSNQYPVDVKHQQYLEYYFIGETFQNQNQIGHRIICDFLNAANANGGVFDYYAEQHPGGLDVLHGRIMCRYHFEHLYNTILALKNDIYFGEVIYVQFTFAPIMNWLWHLETNNVMNNIWHPHVGMRIVNPKLLVCYNKDPTCNANTINFYTHHPIDFTDFNVVQLTKDPIPGNRVFNYNFSINSSIGSYVKFILYRAYVNNVWIEE